MIKPTYITRPVQRAPAQPDVATHTDIDWRNVSVAEAIDADRQRQIETIARLKAARAAKPKGWLRTLAEVMGIRRTRA